MNHNIELSVDQHKIKFAMAATLLLIALSWVLDSWVPVGIAALCQLIGATGSQFAPYFWVYLRVLVPLKIIQPNTIPDDPVPHQFASLIGGIMTLIATSLLLANISIAGWTVLIIIFIFQSLNFWVNFCMMYYLYYVMNRLGVPGFGITKVSED